MNGPASEPPSRLRRHPATNLPSLNSFGELSHFLRNAVADEDSRQMSEGMAQLATHIEALVTALRHSRERSALAPLLMDLLTELRKHRQQVVGLAPIWRGLHEYPGYLQALNNFRVLVGQWLLGERPSSAELQLTAEDFELVGWRTLAEGMLLIDMYEEWAAGEAAADPDTVPQDLSAPEVDRALQWWKRLRL